MRLNTKSRYGVRAMFDMAYHGGGKAVLLRDIARRQGISSGYLEQIFLDLKQAGLISGQRGPRGGYLLSKPAEEINIADIVLAIEKDVNFVGCLSLNGSSEQECCEIKEDCVTRNIWAGATEVLLNYLLSVTLKDLCSKAKDLGIQSALASRYVFYI